MHKPKNWVHSCCISRIIPTCTRILETNSGWGMLTLCQATLLLHSNKVVGCCARCSLSLFTHHLASAPLSFLDYDPPMLDLVSVRFLLCLWDWLGWRLIEPCVKSKSSMSFLIFGFSVFFDDDSNKETFQPDIGERAASSFQLPIKQSPWVMHILLQQCHMPQMAVENHKQQGDENLSLYQDLRNQCLKGRPQGGSTD